MTRLISSSVLLSSFALFACGGGSGNGAAASGMDEAGGAANHDGATASAEAGADAEEVADDTTPEEMADDLPDTQEEVDDIAPTIVAVSPEDGAKGVLRDSALVIQFSEAMDREATEEAYVSEGIPAEGVAFSWSSDGTELTITPSDYLEYGVGLDPESAVTKQYSYTISSGARDLAGNTLEQKQSVSFQTGRLILQETPIYKQYTGMINTQTKEISANLGTGDDAEDVTFRGFVSFQPVQVPEERLDLIVLLETQQVLASSEVFSQLGGVRISAGAFDGEDALLAISMEESLGVVSDSMDLGVRQVDVTSAVEPLLEEGTPPQFVLEFEQATDEDQTADGVFFDANATRLLTGYVIE